jgi:hypothetical protein
MNKSGSGKTAKKAKGSDKAQKDTVVDNSLSAVDKARKYLEEVPKLFKDLK